MRMKLLAILAVAAAFFLAGCRLARIVTATDLDIERFELHRLAVIEKKKADNIRRLAVNLEKRSQAGNQADISVRIAPSLLQKIAAQYIGRTWHIGRSKSYRIDSLKASQDHGSVFLSVFMSVKEADYGVDMTLVTDCLISFSVEKNILRAEPEPFNISPVAGTGLLLSGMESVIENMVRINMNSLGEHLPPLEIPVDFESGFTIDKTVARVRDKISADISAPGRQVSYKTAISDILIFKEYTEIFFDLKEINVY